MRRVIISWSGGKDSYWALHQLILEPDVEIAGLITGIDIKEQRVALTATQKHMVRLQARRLRLPLREVDAAFVQRRAEYVDYLKPVYKNLAEQGITHVAFGDIHLQESRDRREAELAETGLEPLFPNWGAQAHDYCRGIVEAGVRAVVSSLDSDDLEPTYLGREVDRKFLDDLPAGTDPCGEHGEFHTFVYDAPEFTSPIKLVKGQRMERKGYWYIELFEDQS